MAKINPKLSEFLSAGMYNSKPLANVAFTPNAGLTYDGKTGWGNALGVGDNSGKYSNWNKPYTGLTPDQLQGMGNLLPSRSGQSTGTNNLDRALGTGSEVGGQDETLMQLLEILYGGQ